MSPISPSASSSSEPSAFQRAFAACPLVAILRGLQPTEAVEIGQVLYEAGFRFRFNLLQFGFFNNKRWF